ncbi:MAG: 4Fe-4S dicluster domain-containing protein [Ignavibacteria bacterium]|nr:4Fe-4S dicluster domain-containing protein [Ignavibacteria bacterium]
MSDRKLNSSSTKQWKSIEHLAGSVQDSEQEFSSVQQTAPLIDSPVSRRGFMTVMSASMALTAVACRRPEQKLISSVKSHQTAIPGTSIDYATVYSHRNVAYGALVKSREGRPIKVKGNEQHSTNVGTTSAEMQASLLSLYDPDRIRRPRVNRGATSTDNATQKIADGIAEAQANGKKAIVFVSEHCSPSYSKLMGEISTQNSTIEFVTLPSIICDNAAVANKAMFGLDGEFALDLSQAKVVVSVDSDVLGTDKLALLYTRQWATQRSPTGTSAEISKWIMVESQYSLTGANADERVKLHPSQLEPFLAVIEQEIVGSNAVGGSIVGAATAETTSQAKRAAGELKAQSGEAVVLAGRHLSPLANAISLSINNTLGCVGAGRIVDPQNEIPNSGQKSTAVSAAIEMMKSGNVHVVLFADVNPEYSASKEFRNAVAKVPVRAAVNLYEDETADASICSVSIPSAHWLESWGDAISVHGEYSIQQPLIAPLNEGVPSLQDTLISIAKKLSPEFLADTENYYSYVMKNAVEYAAGLDTDAAKAWSKLLTNGVVKSAPRGSYVFNAAGTSALEGSKTSNSMQLQINPSIALYDGKYANNSWLQELPDPVTKITWDNVALMSANTAVSIGVAATKSAKDLAKANEKVVTISTKNGEINLPVYVQVGMADNVIATAVGYGRTAGGRVLMGVGSNCFGVAQSSNSLAFVAISSVKVVEGALHKIATTQNHHTLDDGNGERPIAKWLSAADFKNKKFVGLEEEFPNTGNDGKYLKPLSVNPGYEYKGHRWGMTIDMSSCTGCSSCIIACQSENNIPTVGKEQVILGREMHWIRLDRYYVGDMENPASIMEPMLCQHCENASCENVCPVAATTHSPEGLNEMTYNRCVGTRYCLNNCAYKVRRFNFLNYDTDKRAPLDMVFNPDVTVRMRGIMEKCTFCVQRLHEAKWHAQDDGRARINDGEAITACQEACPAGAIIFGDMNDKDSRVSKARMGDRGFRVLSELNVRPSITYLAKVRNANITSSGVTEEHASSDHHS